MEADSSSAMVSFRSVNSSSVGFSARMHLVWDSGTSSRSRPTSPRPSTIPSAREGANVMRNGDADAPARLHAGAALVMKIRLRAGAAPRPTPRSPGTNGGPRLPRVLTGPRVPAWGHARRQLVARRCAPRGPCTRPAPCLPCSDVGASSAWRPAPEALLLRVFGSAGGDAPPDGSVRGRASSETPPAGVGWFGVNSAMQPCTIARCIACSTG